MAPATMVPKSFYVAAGWSDVAIGLAPGWQALCLAPASLAPLCNITAPSFSRDVTLSPRRHRRAAPPVRPRRAASPAARARAAPPPPLRARAAPTPPPSRAAVRLPARRSSAAAPPRAIHRRQRSLQRRGSRRPGRLPAPRLQAGHQWLQRRGSARPAEQGNFFCFFLI